MMSELLRYSGVYFNDGLALNEAKQRYQERRLRLGNACGCPYVVTGIPHELGHPYPWATVHAPFFQDPLFQFLTGVNQVQCALFVDAARNKTVLFVPKKDLKKEFWDGAKLGCGSTEAEQDVFNLTGLEVADIDSLITYVSDYVMSQALPDLSVFWHEVKEGQAPIDDHHTAFRMTLSSELQKKEWKGTLTNLAPFQWPIRLCLDEVDLNLFKEANRLTLEAMDATIRQLPNLKTELEVSGILHGELLRRTSKGLSFYPIVASGANAAVLHYHNNDAPLPPNGMLLMDCGLRFHSMPADITRSYPISGSLNPLQAILHGIVQDSQRVVEAEIKEGVTIATLNDVCWSTMDRLLEERFLSKGGRMDRPYEKAPHNVSHLIGLAVHDGDPYRNYRDMPLKAGMVISNEPGLYGRFEMEIDGSLYSEPIGIRIEDDIAVTVIGSLNLTRRVV